MGANFYGEQGGEGTRELSFQNHIYEIIDTRILFMQLKAEQVLLECEDDSNHFDINEISYECIQRLAECTRTIDLLKFLKDHTTEANGLKIINLLTSNSFIEMSFSELQKSLKTTNVLNHHIPEAFQINSTGQFS